MASPTPAEFRVNFPEFASTTVYPDSQLTFWFAVAELLLSVTRWGDALRSLGMQLFVAHNMVLEQQAQQQAAKGNLPGWQTGAVNSKQVDKVHIGYESSGAMLPDAGHWNLTTYGTRYLYLVNMIGAGPVQIGAGPLCTPAGFGEAWSGPWPWNFPNMNM